jgi:hypothetical protein
VLRQHYGGYELADCWPRHIHAIWELSTLAAQWHRTYGGTRPDLAMALEFYDRWLPGTMRRITGITRTCMPQRVTLRSPGGLGCSSRIPLTPAPPGRMTNLEMRSGRVCTRPGIHGWFRVSPVKQALRLNVEYP